MRFDRFLLLRFLTLAIVVWALFSFYGQTIINSLLDIFHFEINLFEKNFEKFYLKVVDIHHNKFLELQVFFIKPFMLHGENIFPNPYLVSTATVPVVQIFHPLIIFLFFITILPANFLSEYALRFCIGFPGILLLMALDAPFQLIGLIWESIAREFTPMFISSMTWVGFLNGGGLHVLSIVISFFAVYFSLSIRQKHYQ